MKEKRSPLMTLEYKRDAYGFSVRPQHLQRYREYANIYKEEEEERSEKWMDFLKRQAESAQFPVNDLSVEVGDLLLPADVAVEKTFPLLGKLGNEKDFGGDRLAYSNSLSKIVDEKDKEGVPVPAAHEAKSHKIQIWAEIRPSLAAIEHMTSYRVKTKHLVNDDQVAGNGNYLPMLEDAIPTKGTSEEDSEDEFYDVEKSDPVQDSPSTDNTNAANNGVLSESSVPWKEELECLVHGGVPMALRGELWQAFVGVRACRMDTYYQRLLAPETNTCCDEEHHTSVSDHTRYPSKDSECAPEKWKGQIEKDLPRTFPGHPALDVDGRNALRRLLTAYARHNPSVGYCQAMNFFAALLLLLMPEENAFWTLMRIIDDYFDGYYSEDMIESQVDQLVLEELVRERYPRLVNHLDYLGVQVAWVTGPWFLSIFVNMLPWESVLRVWDVLLFEGNRVMLFRTALALMELYGPALVTTKDAGDAVTLLQSLASATFDSSQLVLTACMGYQDINEVRLEELRGKHRPSVIAATEERWRGLRALRDSKALVSKLYSLNGEVCSLEPVATDLRDTNEESAPDVKQQVIGLKFELCRLLEEKRSALLRADELETALLEMVKQDNRRQLSAKVEMLERELAELQLALMNKLEQERAMLQVLMRVEQEQKVTEDARMLAEQDVAAQRHAAYVLQGKYEKVMASLAQMEMRMVMAESTLEATLQYQSGQNKAQQSPRSVHMENSLARVNQEATQDSPTRKISLLSRPFGLSWRDKNKEKPDTVEESDESKSSNVAQSLRSHLNNGHQE